MKRSILVSIAVVVIVAILAFVTGGEEKYKTLDIGAKAPGTTINMLDISGNSTSLDELKKDNGLLVIFSCNTCPFVIQWEDRYPGLGNACSDADIGMVLVNSNEAKRENADSFEEMKLHASQKKYNCSYVVDEKSVLANSFGAKTTPHVFLFNKDMELVYEGAIDDNSGDASAVKEHYLDDAILNLKNGKTIDPAKTRALGCSIKRLK